MIGDSIHINPEYFHTAEAIFKIINEQKSPTNIPKMVIAIGGESGSGKSVTAMCLQQCLEEKGIHSIVFHMDDYFKNPPLTNHQMRMEDIHRVGVEEVNLDILQRNIDEFKAGQNTIYKPLVNYNANTILEEIVYCEPISILIIEGTYTLSMNHIDFAIFMERTYLDTIESRRKRGRDIQDLEFVELVLEIEHHIIRPMKSCANAIVETNYQVVSISN